MKEKLVTTREVSLILKLSEKEVIDLANAGLIPSFKLGGEFLRFKQEEILKLKHDIKRKYNLPLKKGARIDRLKEFFYFNDFYIVATAIIFILLWIVIKDFYS
jgi:hypothetical protein